MENSFFEFRDKTDMQDDSVCEIIDNSLMDESFAPKKTPAKKNQTLYIPESDDSVADGTEGSEDEISESRSKSKSSSWTNTNVVCRSNDDDTEGQNQNFNRCPRKMVFSSSDDEDSPCPSARESSSPFIVRRVKALRSSDSFIGHRKKKRIMLLDSDSDNSIIIEHNRQRKMICLKETPHKEEVKNNSKRNMSFRSTGSECDESDSNEDDNSNVTNAEEPVNQSNKHDALNNDDLDISNGRENESNPLPSKHSDSGGTVVYDQEDSSVADDQDDQKFTSRATRTKDDVTNNDDLVVSNNLDNESNLIGSKDNDSEGTIEYDHEDSAETDDQDDQMFVSRATRMSIMGVIPKDGSDESDFIQSDSSRPASSLDELPDCGLSVTKSAQKNNPDDVDDSKLTCSPFSSPLQDITNRENGYALKSEAENSFNKSITKSNARKRLNNDSITQSNVEENFDDSVSQSNVIDLTHIETDGLKGKVAKRLHVIDDDVTIIDKEPEVIHLSSDSEDELKAEKSPSSKRSPSAKRPAEKNKSSVTKKVGSDIKQYLEVGARSNVPASYPNQVEYVRRHVRDRELNKLNELRQEMQNVKYLLESMDTSSLPDGGVKLITKLKDLEAEVRRKGDRVANMIVETDEPVIMVGDKDEGLTWDDIQKASNEVQPRMFGKQAMTTHLAERNLILERLRELYQSLESCPPEHKIAKPPRSLQTKLMQHQQHALAWLHWRETQNPCGGILADDMGLGKTITMISLIASDKEQDKDDGDDKGDGDKKRNRLVRGGTLVVCPASLMQQWAGEVNKHCVSHSLSVILHHGAQRATQPHRLANSDMILTTYNILQRETEKGGVLTRIHWRRIILDEAHAVRNHKSATSSAVSALNGKRRWALTGTPLHNKDLDLFALLKFLKCTPFDELTMWKKWIDNKSKGGQERLSTIMRCVMLRRTKQQLQEKGQLDCLPERSTHQCAVTLAKEEMNVYQKVLVFSKTLFAQFLHQRAEKQADNFVSNTTRDTAYYKMHKKMIALQGAKPVKSHEILVLLLRLRQVCCHCGLIGAMLDEDSADLDEDPAGKDLLAELNKLSLEEGRSKRMSRISIDSQDDEVEEPPVEGTTVAEAIRSVLSPKNPVFNLERRSSKITAVMDCLNKNVFSNKGEKAVVVSQWTSVLRLVERELAHAGVPTVTLNGSVAVPARPPLIQRLNDESSDVRVMLLSLCAGGVGLNLCGANHLLLLDPHWNPQLEQQAQDRIYRVGQRRPVHIYRFMCVDTVEQSIRKLQEAKLELAENVLTGARHTNASKLTIEDLKVLFNMAPQVDDLDDSITY
ncbi:transcription termination factor 2 [Leptidea sinapis]|uniref:transcription termination factor 2 n=1 Tax=Leptidea sinapis TaxID=189913 RepID=UPI0021378A5C|nr:transcription termination factor 2 [Leptidea sinapis]